MAQAAWEKPVGAQAIPRASKSSAERLKFLIGGGLILAAVAYLLITGTLSGAQYFITVDDLLAKPEHVGQTVRITGAVIGESIVYDDQALLITFTVANVPNAPADLGQALRDAVTNPDANRLQIRVENTVKPELLQGEAQAIMTGMLGTDGVFHVTELLLKCPSRFMESGPQQGQLMPASEEQVQVGTGS